MVKRNFLVPDQRLNPQRVPRKLLKKPRNLLQINPATPETQLQLWRTYLTYLSHSCLKDPLSCLESPPKCSLTLEITQRTLKSPETSLKPSETIHKFLSKLHKHLNAPRDQPDAPTTPTTVPLKPPERFLVISMLLLQTERRQEY